MKSSIYVAAGVIAVGLGALWFGRLGASVPEVEVQIGARPALERPKTSPNTPASAKRSDGGAPEADGPTSRMGSAEFAARIIGQDGLLEAVPWAGERPAGTDGTGDRHRATSGDVVKEAAAAGTLSASMRDRVERAFHLASEVQLGIDHIPDPELQRSRQESLLEQLRVRLRAAFADESMRTAALSVVEGLPRIERIEQ